MGMGAELVVAVTAEQRRERGRDRVMVRSAVTLDAAMIQEAREGAVREALRMSGFFLEHWACPALERKALPEARARLIRLLESHEILAPG